MVQDGAYKVIFPFALLIVAVLDDTFEIPVPKWHQSSCSEPTIETAESQNRRD